MVLSSLILQLVSKSCRSYLYNVFGISHLISTSTENILYQATIISCLDSHIAPCFCPYSLTVPSQQTSWVLLKNMWGHVVALLRTLQWFQISHITRAEEAASIPFLSTTILLCHRPQVLSIPPLFTLVSLLILGGIRVLSQGLCTCLSHSLEFSFPMRLLFRFLPKHKHFKEAFLKHLIENWCHISPAPPSPHSCFTLLHSTYYHLRSYIIYFAVGPKPTPNTEALRKGTCFDLCWNSSV